jgi:hypothetical protein
MPSAPRQPSLHRDSTKQDGATNPRPRHNFPGLLLSANSPERRSSEIVRQLCLSESAKFVPLPAGTVAGIQKGGEAVGALDYGIRERAQPLTPHLLPKNILRKGYHKVPLKHPLDDTT